MKNLCNLIGLFICAFFTSSCGVDSNNTNNLGINPNRPEGVYGVTQFENIADIQSQIKPDAQTFGINDTSTNSTITGASGTTININANGILTTGGTPYTGVVTANLSEYLTPNAMILSGLQTSSDGQLLVTGGSFDFSLKGANGESLKLNDWSSNARMPVEVTLEPNFQSSMQYYIGERIEVDGREQVNWSLNKRSQEFAIFDGFADFYGLTIGLANCDVLYNSVVTGLGTQFSVLLEGVTAYSNAIVWMYINDFPSVVQITTLIENEEGFKTYDDSIPLGLNASLLAINVDEENYLKYGTLQVEVQGDDVFTIPLEYGTAEDLVALINSL